jgi:hypothetical protein
LQRCPACDNVLTAETINIKEGVALCPKCGKLSRLSELTYSDRSIQEILSKPPAGCSIIALDHGVIARASLRSVSGFIFPALFALFWNGVISLFVSQAIAGLYANLIGPVPEWFPSPGLKDGMPQMNGGPMDLGMTLYLCLFMIPFVTIGIGMASLAIMNLIGKVEVAIDELEANIATGFGIFVWRRRFDPREVRSVNFGETAWRSNGGANAIIELVCDRTIKFGSMLQADRMEWLRVVLKELLLHNETNRSSSLPHLNWLSRKPN